ncbi:hypothetical protein HYPSUDRAFT_790490 [Hypholoma sublateritium FD-334 SS-4]|uniref:Uncharacterized protein n=1 Tax=Hypholoma sublateritium (strain FD-334 SS-4) TaxID=945553 RepID=A0A0D2MVC2_HYPSF|nr:hypothetical protein HYPSUDRAFT_790490 [Hypholoma sublateritium FD-334 SS-4]
MIIQTEDTPKTPLLDAQQLPRYLASLDTPLQTDSPPAYYGSHGPYVPQGPPQPYIVGELPLPAYKHERPPTSRRFLCAFFVTVFIWILLGIFLRTLIPWSAGWGNDKTRWGYDIPSGIAISGCMQGDNWNAHNLRTTENDIRNSSLARQPNDFPYNSLASFSLPVDSDSLFLLGRGQLSSGTLDIITSPEQPRDSVTIQIRVYYSQESARQLVKLCKLAYNVPDKPNGVGLFTPQWRNGESYDDKKEDQVMFETTVILPEICNGEPPLHIKEFRADAPSTTHRFGDLDKKIHFDSVTLNGLNASVEVTSLSARVVHFEMKNGSIRGKFNATDSVVLSTTNGEIDVDVGLEYRDGAKPALIARTSNSPINADISLASASRHASDASYVVSATTSNSDLHLRFAAQPVDSRLDLSASTTNGPADVSVHPAYEGHFVLQSSTGALIHEEKDVRDPSGYRRERHVHFRELQSGGMSVVEGRVQWWRHKGPRRHHDAGGTRRTDGIVSVSNTNAPLTFAL